MPEHAVVSQEEWIRERKQLLAAEKDLTHRYDAVARMRRELPWVRIEKEYWFDGPSGKVSLADLFQGRSQLIVRHFMFGPDWEQGCIGCSFASDHVEGALVHLEHHDVSYAAISRAPMEKLAAYKRRMGWKFAWVSSFGSDFNYDFHVSFTAEEAAEGKAFYNYGENQIWGDEGSGLSVFFREPDGSIYHTYSTFGRGDEKVVTAYMYLDLTPKGRNENGPNFSLGDWVKRHDQYDPVLVTLG